MWMIYETSFLLWNPNIPFESQACDLLGEMSDSPKCEAQTFIPQPFFFSNHENHNAPQIPKLFLYQNPIPFPFYIFWLLIKRRKEKAKYKKKEMHVAGLTLYR